MGTENLPRGAHVRIRLGAIDEISMEVAGTVIERLDLPVDELDDAGSEESDGDDEGLAAPLALAISVDEADTEEATAASATASPPVGDGH
jgi:exoribonuclease-2